MGLERGWVVLRAERSFAGRCPPQLRECVIPIRLDLGSSVLEHRLCCGQGLDLPLTLVRSRGWLELAALCSFAPSLGIPWPLPLHPSRPAPASPPGPHPAPGTSLEQLPLPSSCPPPSPEPGSCWQEKGVEPGGRVGHDRALAARRMPPLTLWASTMLAKPSCTGESTDLVVTRPVYLVAAVFTMVPCWPDSSAVVRNPVTAQRSPIKVSSYQISSHQVSSLPLFPFLGVALGPRRDKATGTAAVGTWGQRCPLSCHHCHPSISSHLWIPFSHPASAPARGSLRAQLPAGASGPSVGMIFHPRPVQPVHTSFTGHMGC